MKKLTVSLYPEASHWLAQSDIISAVLYKLNIRTMSKEESHTRAMTLTDKEYYALREEAMRRGESVTMMINEQIIQLGRQLMGTRQKRTNEIFIVYLDRLLKMYPEITDFKSMMDVCWKHYYVPEDIDEMYLITDRIDDVAFQIANEAVNRNIHQTRITYYAVDEDQFARIAKRGVKTYVERPTETITQDMRRVYTSDSPIDRTNPNAFRQNRSRQRVQTQAGGEC